MKSIYLSVIGDTIAAGWQQRFALCLTLLTGLASAEDGSVVKGETANATPASCVLKTDSEKLSYALGMNVGLTAQKQILRGSLEVDTALFVQAINDTLSGRELLLSLEAADTILVTQRQALHKRDQHARAELGVRNQQEQEKFLAKNKAEENIVTLASGLQYKVLKAGDGVKPKEDDTVRCEYRGTLLDGTEIDSTAKRGGPASLALKLLIDGWREALELMPVGSKWQIVIPSKLAYGEKGAGNLIGPNAALLFEVELLGLENAASKPAAAVEPAQAEALAGVGAHPITHSR